jgi:trehalose 6-phosphate synthase/phosphatase
VPGHGVVVAFGDDRTDEDLFERLPADAWTVKVGRGITAARWSVDGPDDVLRALEAVADAVAPPKRKGR